MCATRAGLYLSCTGKKNVSLTETPDDTCRWTPTLNGLQSDNGMLQYNASSAALHDLHEQSGRGPSLRARRGLEDVVHDPRRLGADAA